RPFCCDLQLRKLGFVFANEPAQLGGGQPIRYQRKGSTRSFHVSSTGCGFQHEDRWRSVKTRHDAQIVQGWRLPHAPDYNACRFSGAQPVTIRFADAVGEILTTGPIENQPSAFKYYI